MRTNVRFVGFTEGMSPFGRQPLFAVALQDGGERVLLKAEIERLGVIVPVVEQRRLVDAGHTFNNAGICDDNLLRFGPSVRLSLTE